MGRGAGISKPFPKIQQIIETSSAEETLAFGRYLASSLKSGSLVALFGDLGAGKTTLIKGIVSEISKIHTEEICSPTFSYLNIYEEGQIPVYHFDLYRLNSVEEFLDLGFDEFLFGEGIACLEWSERIASILPSYTQNITLTYDGADKRRILYEF